MDEVLLLGSYMLGSESDIINATNLAITRIDNGMDPAARPINYGQFVDNTPHAEEERMALVAAACQAARSRAEALVAEHRDAIATLAGILAERGHLSGDELDQALVRSIGREMFEAATTKDLGLTTRGGER